MTRTGIDCGLGKMLQQEPNTRGMVLTLLPGLKQGRRRSSRHESEPATGIQRIILFVVGALAAYRGLKMTLPRIHIHQEFII
jgi:hypothetical protein